jgi:hypothetical protein
VEQAVEAAGRALAEVDALDQDRPVAPHGGVANDPEAGRAAADDQDVTLVRDYS